ncbi:MAG: CRISPR-associated endonuclease Cas2 [Calditrichaeota bacterium]|nr:MAG: CRISPR-associated endonuclease Cas2 [Calditrichota bacterium]
MLVWVIYDIVKDKPRNKVAKACLQAGIQRVQYSVFLGDLNSNEIDELGLKIKALIDEDTDRVYIFPMCKEDFSKVRLMGQAFDKKLITNEIRELFL